MLIVKGIQKGIVIDHIKAGLGYKIFTELKLDAVEYTTALIRNVPSKKIGNKDLIKIDNVIHLDLDMLSLIDPDLTICIIENETVVEKLNLNPPIKVKGIFTCKNPRCITSIEKNIIPYFTLVDQETRTYKCEFCDTRASLEE